jgi:hypothetical protein
MIKHQCQHKVWIKLPGLPQGFDWICIDILGFELAPRGYQSHKIHIEWNHQQLTLFAPAFALAQWLPIPWEHTNTDFKRLVLIDEAYPVRSFHPWMLPHIRQQQDIGALFQKIGTTSHNN